MPQPTFKLSTSTIAILNENAQPHIVTIEANALMTLVDGDTEANGFVRVRCEDKVLSMFARPTSLGAVGFMWGTPA
jgi:hypothetical protein